MPPAHPAQSSFPVMFPREGIELCPHGGTSATPAASLAAARTRLSPKIWCWMAPRGRFCCCWQALSQAGWSQAGWSQAWSSPLLAPLRWHPATARSWHEPPTERRPSVRAVPGTSSRTLRTGAAPCLRGCRGLTAAECGPGEGTSGSGRSTLARGPGWARRGPLAVFDTARSHRFPGCSGRCRSGTS